MKRLSWSILLVIPFGAFAADVYKSVDANGVVVYSDLPRDGAERVTVRTTPGSSPSASSRASSQADGKPAEDNSPLGAEIPRESTPDEIAADRARNCEYARQKLQTYSNSHRLYRNGADGERVYLSDDEITEARAKAETDVAEWCN